MGQEALERLAGVAALTVAGWLAWVLAEERLRRKAAPRPANRLPGMVLDTVLMWWTPLDPLTLKTLLDGGIVILGRPGSGKSSSSSFQILRAVANLPRAGGLILSASHGDLALCQRAFGDQAHRLVVFNERSRFNAISFLLACGGSTKDILAAIFAITESVARSGGRGGDGENGSFFSEGAKRIIECSIIVVKHATGDVGLADLMAFINTAASSVAEVHTEEFKETLHYRYLRAAYNRQKSESETYDYDLARAFFTQELPKMADKTRTSLIAVVMNVVHIFNSGLNRLLFATGTTISPTLMDQGYFIFVDLPISRFGQEGAFALGVWKFVVEWFAMRRDSTRDNPPLIIHADEFHRTINQFDTLFLGECRKFSACMIACTQSKASLLANMGGDAAEAQVDALLNNFSTKVIHALGDIKTAQWCSDLIGTDTLLSLGGSEQPADSLLGSWMGRGNWSASFSEHPRPVVEARRFLHGFRTGGAANGGLCDAILIRSGEGFASNKQNFLPVVFRQE